MPIKIVKSFLQGMEGYRNAKKRTEVAAQETGLTAGLVRECFSELKMTSALCDITRPVVKCMELYISSFPSCKNTYLYQDSNTSALITCKCNTFDISILKFDQTCDH